MLMAIIEYDSKRISSFIFIDEDMKSFNVADELVVDNYAENGSSVSDSLKCRWR
jgi:hypothetical protein